MLRMIWIFVAALAAFAPAAALSDREHRVERVAFRDGKATIKGRIKGYEYIDYVFPVGAGESMTVTLKPAPRSSNYFNLMGPGETETAFFIGSTSGESYEGVAPVSGDYTARVYLMRNDARRGKIANYVLTIVLGRRSVTNEQGPDFADGLTGGPDFWEVTGVGAGDTLNMRSEPSPNAGIVAQFPNGAVLKNLGCKNTGGQRWCRAERSEAPPAQGWVKGRYLREASGPAAGTK
ncbi:MAG TPA: SH3 domain-containing protein [Roseiarcus sp.]|nr:SH3 domain-containing protein [Roseiarcus sp.]